MAKIEQFLSESDALAIVASAEYGVLSTVGADGDPYGVPINYVYVPDERALFFHCLRRGRKLDNIAANPRVSLVAVGEETLVPERFTTRYRSAMVFGVASVVEDDDERYLRLVQLNEALAPEHRDRYDEVITKYLPKVAIVRVDIERVSGKMNDGK